ncbi:MAG: AAA family ATPase [Eubacteriales bacterium]|nr:AAA family ATPase [Eubacteriales bacterium]
MFNLYYINYAKAFEIAMQINNKLLETQVATKEKQIDGDGSISGGTGSFLEKVLPHLQVNAGLSGSKSDRAVDTLRVVSTNEHKCDNITFIIDKRYAEGICQNLPYFFSGVERIEEELEIDKNNTTNIVDIPLERFHDVEISFAQNLFGNRKFKQRLFEELHKFRILNEIEERKVFSVFLCGPSGIGKTETARLLHNYLAPKERFIKINLGNYSEQNALSSLIGSPRGFIGSSKGELTEKINSSKSRVILIDEFEKAS